MTRRALLALALAVALLWSPARAESPTPDGHMARVAAASRAFRDATAVTGTTERRRAFSSSAALFDAALADGPRNGALEFNAANAWFLAGDIGRAVLHYRRAELLRPGDARVAANLATARARRVDRFEETSSSALLNTLVFWHRGLSLGTKVPLALGAWVGAFSLLALSVWLPRHRLGRQGARRSGGALLVVALAVGASAVVDLAERSARDAAVVIADEAALRTGDGWSYPERYENPIHAGTEVRVLETRAGWSEVELPDAKRGWLPVDAVERI